MKKTILLITVLAILTVFWGCAKKMNDEQYDTINNEIADNFVEFIVNSEFIDDDEVLDEMLTKLIESVNEKYGFNTKQYMNAMKANGDELEGLWVMIDRKLQEAFDQTWEEEQSQIEMLEAETQPETE